MGELIAGVGREIVDWVLWAANWLVGDEAPGIVFGIILVLLVALIAHILLEVGKSIHSISLFTNILNNINTNNDEHDILEKICYELTKLNKKYIKEFIIPAWDNFKESIYPVKVEDSNKEYVTSILPGHVFVRGIFRLKERFWRSAPNIFVSLGLLLTFLGIIAALHQFRTENGGGINPAVMSDFLRIASAKFIMSVAGLLSSIIIIIVTRVSLGWLDKKLFILNRRLNELFPYKSLEEMAQEQLHETRKQRENMQKVAFEVAAQIARPLKEDVPEAISQSIRDELQPILKTVQAQGTEGVQEMVGTLSERLTQEVGNALSDASGRLERAAQKLSEVAETLAGNVRTMGEGLSEQARMLANSVAGVQKEMDEQSQRMLRDLQAQLAAMQEQSANHMQQLVAGLQSQMQVMSEQLRVQLNQTAAFMDEETRKLISSSRASLISPLQEMAKQLSAESDRLAEMLNKVSGQIEEKARESASAMQAQVEELQVALQQSGAGIAREVGEAARGVLSAAQAQVLPPLKELAEQLQRAAEATRNGATGMSEAAEGLRSGASAAHEASGAFRRSAEAVSHSTGTLEKTFTAFRESNETALQRFAEMAQAIEGGARLLETAVQEARKALAAEQHSLATVLKELEAAIQATGEYHEGLDKLDEKLSDALKHYDENISRSLEKIRETVSQIDEDLENPLTILREVVQQVEQFRPRQREEG